MAQSDRYDVRRTTGDDRVVAGVAAGVARTLGLDPVLVRIVFVVIAVTTGIGAVAYLVAAVFLPEDDGEPRPPVELEIRRGEQVVGVACMLVGLLLLARRAGFLLPDEIVWPTIVIAAGAALSWSRLGPQAGVSFDPGRVVVARVFGGGLLIAIGIAIFVALNDRLLVATQVGVAVAVTTGGVMVLAGPWIVRLARQVATERAERIRADERAEVAAHLHDSVLQTLALIQRRVESPAETVALARRQERELRAWLNGADVSDGEEVVPMQLSEALRALADEVESRFVVSVEVVTVGDVDLDESTSALVAAIREAVVNAAKHSGSIDVSVYAEVDEDECSAFVRDRGVGFDADAVASDRRGLADSVVGRMERHGGTATISSSPSDGTEVTLRLPRKLISR